MYITKLSIKDLERTDFQYNHAQQPNNTKPTTTSARTTAATAPAAATAAATTREASPFDSSDSSSDDDEYDDDDFDPENNHDLDVRDYDGLRYSGQSAGLPLVDESMFQSKSYLPWPGRDDVVLKMMAQDEVMIVKTSPGKKGDTKHLDVGLSMRTALLERPLSPPTRRSATPLRASQALSDEMMDLYVVRTMNASRVCDTDSISIPPPSSMPLFFHHVFLYIDILRTCTHSCPS